MAICNQQIAAHRERILNLLEMAYFEDKEDFTVKMEGRIILMPIVDLMAKMA